MKKSYELLDKLRNNLIKYLDKELPSEIKQQLEFQDYRAKLKLVNTSDLKMFLRIHIRPLITKADDELLSMIPDKYLEDTKIITQDHRAMIRRFLTAMVSLLA